MADPKKLGTLRSVLTAFSQQFVAVNEDLEAVSLAKGVMDRKSDLIPRVYCAPEASVKMKCKASLDQSTVSVFGLGKADTKDSELVELEIEMPIRTVPFTPEQMALVEKTTAEEVRKRLAERNLLGGGSLFHPDEV